VGNKKPATAGFLLPVHASFLDDKAHKMRTAARLLVIHIVLPGTYDGSLILSHATKNKHFFSGGII